VGALLYFVLGVIPINTRKVDQIGRIIIPVGVRDTLKIKTGDEMEISILNGGVFVRPHKPGCYLCGEQNDIKEFRGYKMCCECRKDIGDL